MLARMHTRAMAEGSAGGPSGCEAAGIGGGSAGPGASDADEMLRSLGGRGLVGCLAREVVRIDREFRSSGGPLSIPAQGCLVAIHELLYVAAYEPATLSGLARRPEFLSAVASCTYAAVRGHSESTNQPALDQRRADDTLCWAATTLHRVLGHAEPRNAAQDSRAHASEPLARAIRDACPGLIDILGSAAAARAGPKALSRRRGESLPHVALELLVTHTSASKACASDLLASDKTMLALLSMMRADDADTTAAAVRVFTIALTKVLGPGQEPGDQMASLVARF